MSSLNYSDVYLVPKYSTLRSRSEADVSVDFLGKKFNSPVIPANMSSVINEDIAKWLSENGYFYIMHRFGNTFEFVKRANKEKWKTISISVGVKKEDLLLIHKIIQMRNLRVDFITIDVAHGHSILVKEMIEYINDVFKSKIYKYTWGMPKIIAGNIATSDAVRELANWGADAVKVGLSMGKACTTYNQTGIGSPMFSTLKECCSLNIPIIGDGGIREMGDISKGLSCGAQMIMVGSMISACLDSAAKTIIQYQKNGFCNADGSDKIIEVKYKEYYGSASQYNTGKDKYIEGKRILLESNNLTIAQFYQNVQEAVASCISYAGGAKVKDLCNLLYKIR